jgi:hypothetical protein
MQVCYIWLIFLRIYMTHEKIFKTKTARLWAIARQNQFMKQWYLVQFKPKVMAHPIIRDEDRFYLNWTDEVQQALLAD